MPAAAAISQKPKPPDGAKFSSDTERLQLINSIRKSPVGAQIKRVIDLLFEVLLLVAAAVFPRSYELSI